jgi:hypothetical protein
MGARIKQPKGVEVPIMDLFGVSYFIKPGSTCGVVGRTWETPGKDIALSCGERHPNHVVQTERGGFRLLWQVVRVKLERPFEVLIYITTSAKKRGFE